MRYRCTSNLILYHQGDESSNPDEDQKKPSQIDPSPKEVFNANTTAGTTSISAQKALMQAHSLSKQSTEKRNPLLANKGYFRLVFPEDKKAIMKSSSFIQEDHPRR